MHFDVQIRAYSPLRGVGFLFSRLTTFGSRQRMLYVYPSKRIRAGGRYLSSGALAQVDLSSEVPQGGTYEDALCRSL